MPRSRIRGLNSCENLLLSDIEFEMVAAEEEVCHTRKKLAGRAREGLSSCDFVDPRPRRKRSTKPHEIKKLNVLSVLTSTCGALWSAETCHRTPRRERT